MQLWPIQTLFHMSLELPMLWQVELTPPAYFSQVYGKSGIPSCCVANHQVTTTTTIKLSLRSSSGSGRSQKTWRLTSLRIHIFFLNVGMRVTWTFGKRQETGCLLVFWGHVLYRWHPITILRLVGMKTWQVWGHLFVAETGKFLQRDAHQNFYELHFCLWGTLRSM